MNKTYQVNDLIVDLKIENDKINGIYFKPKKEDVKGVIELSKIGDVFKGTFTDFNGDKGTMILDSIDDNSFEIRWGAGIDNENPKGKWKGTRDMISSPDQGSLNKSNSISNITEATLDGIKQFQLIKVDENAIETNSIYECIVGSITVVTDDWEENMLLQLDFDGIVDEIEIYNDIDGLNNAIENIIKEKLGIEAWEASGLIEYVEHDTLDTLDEEEIEYEISDCGEFDFDEIQIGMKGIGMTFSEEIELNIENGKIMIEGNEISELGEIIGYVSSEDKEFILLK